MTKTNSEFQTFLNQCPKISTGAGPRTTKDIAELYRERIKILSNEQEKIFNQFLIFLAEKENKTLTENEKDFIFDYMYNNGNFDFESKNEKIFY